MKCVREEKRDKPEDQKERRQVGNLGQVLMASGLALGEILRQDQERSSTDTSGGSNQHLPCSVPTNHHPQDPDILLLFCSWPSRAPYSHYSSWQHVEKLGEKQGKP